MVTDEVALEPSRWPRWPREGVAATTFRGRRCLEFAPDSFLSMTCDVAMADGCIEVDMAVGAQRSFHGVVWRAAGPNYESFFVRPHQAGNPDAVQYTPVLNNVSSWQLYHGDGYWAPIRFPVERWFRLRVAFNGSRGEAFIDDMDVPALVFNRLKLPAGTGLIGLLVGGPGLRVARFAYDWDPPLLRGAPPRRLRSAPGTVSGWWVSQPVREGSPPSAGQGWQWLDAEPGGLANLARLHPVRRGRDTVFAKAAIHSPSATSRSLAFGFSDRAVVYLNGRRLFTGNDTYRSRDYRFLGSIGYWYSLDLPLQQGDNELVMAVSESFGGWGLMARLL